MYTSLKFLNRFVFASVVAVLLVVLTGCSIQPAGTSTDEHAAENRQYMAQLNQKTSELDEVLTQFQAAIAAGDAVGMKAAASDASKIVDAIAATEATESLTEVKESYMSGLTEINSAMNDYVDLYTDVATGKVTQQVFDRKLKAVQHSYDQAIEKLSAADDILTQLANE